MMEGLDPGTEEGGTGSAKERDSSLGPGTGVVLQPGHHILSFLQQSHQSPVNYYHFFLNIIL